NNKHDLVALQIFDKRETQIPPIGLVKLKDAETGKYTWVDFSDRQTRDQYMAWWNEHSEKLHNSFTRTGVDYVTINTGDDYVKSLISLFKKRG
ncbi:MAG: DUF58 domain-containing protein, partial [Bacteroidota bacterium]|nr:DUF58 domain-containing protein [Bacteroidota bacterium]